MTIVIVNTGGGDGQVEVKITVREGDRVVGRAKQATELKSNETVTLVLDLSVPGDAKELRVEAEVVYPPD